MSKLEAGRIIAQEFGEKESRKGLANENFWWNDLIDRTSEIVEKAQQLGYENCHKIHKDKIMAPTTKPLNEKCLRAEICKFYEKEEK